jgi:hypothetical protein
VELSDVAGKPVASAVTDASGHFALRVRATRPLDLRAIAAGIGSSTLQLRVKPLVRLHRRVIAAGLRVTGSVRPVSRALVDLEQRSGKQWIVVGSTRLRKGKFSIVVRGVHRGHFRLVIDN